MSYAYDHDCPFEAFITNLGKYNEGALVGEWVKFPTTAEELQKTAMGKRRGQSHPKRVGGRCEPMGEPCRTGLGVACLSLRWGRAGRVLPLQRTLLAGGAAEGGGVIRSRIRVV